MLTACYQTRRKGLPSRAADPAAILQRSRIYTPKVRERADQNEECEEDNLRHAKISPPLATPVLLRENAPRAISIPPAAQTTSLTASISAAGRAIATSRGSSPRTRPEQPVLYVVVEETMRFLLGEVQIEVPARGLG